MALDTKGQPVVASAEWDIDITSRGLYIYRWNGSAWVAAPTHHPMGIIPWDHYLDVAVNAAGQVTVGYTGTAGGLIARLTP